MHNWPQVREEHRINETFYGHGVLQFESFGHQYKVIDIEKNGHSASTFADHEPIFTKHWGEIKPGEVVVDCGAQFGAYSIPALAMGATVIAFEPWSFGREYLDMNVKVNSWSNRFTSRGHILGDGAMYPQGLAAYAKNADFDDELRLPTSPLDSFHLAQCDWIKMDVEGMEWHLMQGAAETIKRHLPTFIIEDHDGIDPGKGNAVSDYPASIKSSEHIKHLLLDLGYKLELTTHDVSRRYIYARHDSRMT